MREESLRTELLARRADLVQQIDALTAQRDACDIMLAALPPAAPPASAPKVETTLAPPVNAPDVSASSPPIPAVPSAPSSHPKADSSPSEDKFNEPIGEQPDGSWVRVKWGRISARVEQVIAEAGDPFSVDSIVEAYKTRFRWRGYPTPDSIASSFWRVVRKGGYRVIRKGSGRRPTLYTKQKFVPPSVRANNLPGNTPRSTPPTDFGSATPPAARTP